MVVESQDSINSVEKEEGTPDSVENNAVQPTTNEDGFVFDDKIYREKNIPDEAIDIIRSKEKQVWHKEKFIQKQTAEVGLARKRELDIQQREADLERKKQEILSKEEEVKEQFYDNPNAYEDHVFQKKQVNQELDSIKQQRFAMQNEQLIRNKVPDIDSLMVNEMPQILKNDLISSGYSSVQADELVSRIKQGGWKYENPQHVFLLADRARKEKELNTYREKLRNISTTPDDVGKKIAQVANQRPNVPTSSYSVERTYTDDEIRTMNPIERKKILADRLSKSKN